MHNQSGKDEKAGELTIDTKGRGIGVDGATPGLDIVNSDGTRRFRPMAPGKNLVAAPAALVAVARSQVGFPKCDLAFPKGRACSWVLLSAFCRSKVGHSKS